MPHYRLTPIDTENPNWICSTHKGPCLVNADSEQNARDLATATFKTGSQHNPDGLLSVSPWNEPELVDCTEIATLTPAATGEGIVVIPADTDVRPVLNFLAQPPKYNPNTESVRFLGAAGDEPVMFAISLEALTNLERGTLRTEADILAAYEKHLDRIRQVARWAYRLGAFDESRHAYILKAEHFG